MALSCTSFADPIFGWRPRPVAEVRDQPNGFVLCAMGVAPYCDGVDAVVSVENEFNVGEELRGGEEGTVDGG